MEYKIQTRHAVAKWHKFIEHEDGSITKENGTTCVYGARLTDAGCKNKIPADCFYDGMEIVTTTYILSEEDIVKYGTRVED